MATANTHLVIHPWFMDFSGSVGAGEGLGGVLRSWTRTGCEHPSGSADQIQQLSADSQPAAAC